MVQQRLRQRHVEAADSSDEDILARPLPQSRARLPPFTGKEQWDVWLNRFEDTAGRRAWSDVQKLDELIPLLQGAAGDYVYGQLSQQVRRDYHLLIQELDYRFRRVEARRSLGVTFSRRVQRPSETVQEYAAELKRLYDKAHPNRDRQTRTEDLLRRFRDGLRDEGASFQVEYVKEPADINVAVNEVINFMETKRRPEVGGNENRKRRQDRFKFANEGSDEEGRIARVPSTATNPKPIVKRNPSTSTVKSDDTPTTSYVEELAKFKDELKEALGLLTKRVDGLENGHETMRSNPPGPNTLCFQCGQPGHFVRSCPNRSGGNYEVRPGGSSNPGPHGRPLLEN